MTQEETPEERRARIRAEYDAAIRKHRLKNKRRTERQRKERPEYRELQRRAAQRRKERRDAERLINPPKPPGRPRAPTDGLTPEQIAKREKDRERSAKYRQQCRDAQQRLKIPYRSHKEAHRCTKRTKMTQLYGKHHKRPQRANNNEIWQQI